MTKILHVIGSSQGENSQSTSLAKAYLEARKAKEPNIEIDTLDLWKENLPEYDGDKVAAKATFFGLGEMNDHLQSHWDQIVKVVERFKSADEYVFSVPMWNGGIPYKLKHYIDVITQPSLTYSFNPETGYSGLVEGNKAHVFYTSGLFHKDAPDSWGQDYQSTYLKWYLNFLSIDEVHEIRLQPSAVTEDPKASYDKALEEAKSHA